LRFQCIRSALILLAFLIFLAGCASIQAATPSTPLVSPTITSSTTAPPNNSNSAPQPAGAPTLAQAAPAAPSCTSPATPTPAMTEGPFFKAGSPERVSLLDTGITGTKLLLTGYVLTPDCKPVARALLDFWQANASGQYDNSGYTLRGHQFTDANGRYQLTTIVPGLYPGRTEHIHVKVQAPNGPVLTTQLFFPGVQRNQSDSIFDPKLLMTIQDSGDGQVARYDFVVNQ
jgi:protocatechuate 3,4-dioxygenase beta subunit